VLKLKTPWRDGTTHLVMSPLEFMQRLAALVPRPRLHLFDGDRLVLIAADVIGGRFVHTEWMGLANDTQIALGVESNLGRMQLVLAVSVTAVPEPPTRLLAALGGLWLAAWIRRRRGPAESRSAEGRHHP